MVRTKIQDKNSPSRKTTGKRSSRADTDAITDTLKDIAEELGAAGGSPLDPSTPTDQGASASNEAGAASGSDGAGAGLS